MAKATITCASPTITLEMSLEEAKDVLDSLLGDEKDGDSPAYEVYLKLSATIQNIEEKSR